MIHHRKGHEAGGLLLSVTYWRVRAVQMLGGLLRQHNGRSKHLFNASNFHPAETLVSWHPVSQIQSAIVVFWKVDSHLPRKFHSQLLPSDSCIFSSNEFTLLAAVRWQLSFFLLPTHLSVLESIHGVGTAPLMLPSPMLASIPFPFAISNIRLLQAEPKCQDCLLDHRAR